MIQTTILGNFGKNWKFSLQWSLVYRGIHWNRFRSMIRCTKVKKCICPINRKQYPSIFVFALFALLVPLNKRKLHSFVHIDWVKECFNPSRFSCSWWVSCVQYSCVGILFSMNNKRAAHECFGGSTKKSQNAAAAKLSSYRDSCRP